MPHSTLTRRLLATAALAGVAVLPTACGDGDLKDLAGSLNNAGDCIQLIAQFGQFGVNVLRDEQGQADAQKSLDELKAKAPADVQDDIDVLNTKIIELRDAPDEAARQAIVDSPEFSAATDAITEYIKQTCEQQ
ncbi:MAG: hypothetical protein ACOYML_08200 [Microthrixaceae bacterium]|jgi:hypothetical protein